MLSPDQSTHNQAIHNLLASIALQESFFSDIIYHQSQQLDTLVTTTGVSPDHLYEAQTCLSEISQAIEGLERILQAKIEFFESDCSD